MMVSSVFLSYFLYQFVPAPPSTYTPVTPTAVVGSALTVEVSQAQNGAVPPGSTRVPMLQLRMTASCDGNIPVEGVRVWRRGPGFQEDLTSVYATHGAERLNRGQVPQSNGEIYLRLRRFEIRACETETVMINADFSPTASVASEHRIILDSAFDVEAGGALVTLQQSGRSTEPLRRTSGRPSGVISVEYLPLLNKISYGQREMVGRFRLETDSQDNHLISAITLYNDGSADDDDLTNVYLESGRNQRISRVTSRMNGNYVRLEFDPPFYMEESERRVLQIRADVNVSYKSIRFIIEEPGDIESTTVRGRSF